MAAARWLFTKPVDAAALVGLGLGPGAVDTEPPQLWPCVAQPVALLCALQSQWRLGPSGRAYGLDYAAVEPVMRMLDLPKQKRGELFADLQTLELAALQTMQQ